MDADGNNLIRLTSNNECDRYPQFSPDCLQILFQAEREGNQDICIMNSDGSNQRNLTKNN